MCQHTSSLLNSHNATMQRCIDNAHRKGQLSSTLDIPQLWQLKPFLEQMAMACILWMEKWEVYWTDCFFMRQDLVEIQVEQPQKEDDYQEYTALENLDGFRFEADIYVCLSWTFSVTQSKGHSGLATFYGTGFGIFGWEKYTQAIIISSKKYRVMHLKMLYIKVR